MLHFFLTNNPTVEKSVDVKNNVYTLTYPCADSSSCYDYISVLKPGKYLIELYGASGGHKSGYISTAQGQGLEGCPNQEEVSLYKGNTMCKTLGSMAGAGGYTSGFLYIKKTTKVFISIGGQGQYITATSESYEDSMRPKGGYNGGGKGVYSTWGCSSGGGGTDFRILENDYWHRILVAGGGGGNDNSGGTFRDGDDGAGGAGGGAGNAQGFWINGVYEWKYVATQNSGYSFGNGETAQESGSKNPKGKKDAANSNDRAGAGGGWFGGFSSHDGQGGAGGGSSFALTDTSIIPVGSIPVYNQYFSLIGTKPYAFTNTSEYTVRRPIFSQGIWDGNGMARITFTPFIICTNHKSQPFSIMLFVQFLICS